MARREYKVFENHFVHSKVRLAFSDRPSLSSNPKDLRKMDRDKYDGKRERKRARTLLR